MGKYQLVMAKYNRLTKTYDDEKYVKIDGVDTTDLVSIDKFTSKIGILELEKIVRNSNNLGYEYDTLSIQYFKNKGAKPIYYKVITNNEIISKASDSVTKKDLKSIRRSNTDTVNVQLDCFLKEFSYIEKYKDMKPSEVRADLTDLYSAPNDLVGYITSYKNSYYEDASLERRDYSKIVQEFSRYKTFRGFVVAMEKREKRNLFKTNNQVKKETKKSIEKTEAKPIEVLEEEFEQRFYDKNKIDITTYNRNQYNFENEEFLEDDEFESMDNYGGRKL